MTKENYLVTLDVGSAITRVLVTQIMPEGKPRIIGVGKSHSEGMRRGAIVDIEEVSQSISRAIQRAQQNSGVEIGSVFVSIGGNHIECGKTKGVVAISRADGEVDEGDVKRVIEASKMVNIPQNREILHVIPQKFRLDDQTDIKDPVGMNGVRLEMNGLIITGSSPHIRNITKCLNNIGCEIDGFVISPLAAAKAILNKRQEELGVILIDIGGGTTSLAVYEERQLIHVAVLPIGAGHITNDIAIGLRTSIEVAEKVKLKYGSALVEEINKKEQINLAEIDENEEGTVYRKHVAEIIEARMEEILFMVEKELKKINRSALLPAGAILVGGGARMQGAVDLAKNILKLPAQTGFPVELSGLIDKVDNPSFAVAVGMVVWVNDNYGNIDSFDGNKGGLKEFIKRGKSKAGSFDMGAAISSVKKWAGKFLP